ncbi:MAG: Cobalt/magnesium transport protein CorA [Candidatus Argoarchaeum ethanivorans]|uniref:Magnesium transport protein CorA n=1 Tax=Candidatus Argoarchaeum ethanivorans TaxID=2608793 RepID=A0A811T4X5_9EURY|nr:MAG: Cobalt/magnesium transport protein CorA [Candidatus Argoarchaeum ethanivorans]
MKITAVKYSDMMQHIYELKSLEEIPALQEENFVLWIDITEPTIKELSPLKNLFEFHPLAIEDSVQMDERPKVDDYDEYLFVIAKTINVVEGDISTRQLSIFVSKYVLITIHEKQLNIIDELKEKILRKKPFILKGKEDFLLYRILDGVVDNYITVIEDFEDKIDEIDEEILENPTGRSMKKIRQLIRQVRHIHSIVRGQRDAVSKLNRIDTLLIKPETRIYFRDVYDHTVSLLDSIENIRANAGEALEVYHSSLANKMNEIMKVLTIIATIFIPLTFVTGIYGMNFQGGGTDNPLNMPELYLPYGYVFILMVMATMSISMVIYFNRKGWL